MTVPSWTATITHKQLVAPDLVELRLEKPAVFSYTAGQFVQFLIPDVNGVVLRSYSLASHPKEDHLLFCIKLIPQGKGSLFVQQKNIGESINFQGPCGRFVNDITRALSCVATGAGIAPIFGIIHDELLNKKNTEPITLIWGVRHEEDLFWIDPLTTLAKQFPNFSFTTTLSQPTATWAGLSGRVTVHLATVTTSNQFFLCGSGDMVKDVRTLLISQGVGAPAIHFEIF